MPRVLSDLLVLDESGRLVGTLTPYGAGKLADKLSEAGFKLVRTFGEKEPSDDEIRSADVWER